MTLNSVEFNLSPHICRLSGSSIVCGCDDGVVRIYEIPRAILTDHKLTLKVKHVLEGEFLYSEVPCFVFFKGGLYSEVPCLGRGSLNSEVQCIMGNGHMGPLWTDRHTRLKATSLAGGKNFNPVFENRWSFGTCRWSHLSRLKGEPYRVLQYGTLQNFMPTM